MTFYPKRPVKSFQDLEVYQKTFALAVEIVKKVGAEIIDNHLIVQQDIVNRLTENVLEIPKLIASAHSKRFGDPLKAIQFLEEAMLGCNLAVLYLEEFRDLVNQSLPVEFFEEEIKEYLRVRGKIMRLQKSWVGFMHLP